MQIKKTHHFSTPAARVYAAWVSQDTVIPPATRLEINAHVGGHYRLIIDEPDFSAQAAGVFSHVEPNKRLIYSWQWNGDGEITEIDVTFRENTLQTTDLRLLHSGFVNADQLTMHDQGWDAYLAALASLIATSSG